MKFLLGTILRSHRAISVTLLVCLLALELHGGAAQPSIKLTGFFQHRNESYALLEITSSKSRGETGTVRPILQAGGSNGAVTVLEVNVNSCSVSVSNGGKKQLLTMPHEPADELTNRTLHLCSARLTHLLDVYQTISGRTVLATRDWVDKKVNVKSGTGLTPTEVIHLLDMSLTAAGMATKRLGHSMVAILPKEKLPSLSKLPALPASLAGDEDELAIPRNTTERSRASKLPDIKFIDAELREVLEFYQEVTGRTVMLSANPKHVLTLIVNAAPLSREGVIWALKALLYMNGFAILDPQPNLRVHRCVPVEYIAGGTNQ